MIISKEVYLWLYFAFVLVTLVISYISSLFIRYSALPSGYFLSVLISFRWRLLGYASFSTILVVIFKELILTFPQWLKNQLNNFLLPYFDLNLTEFLINIIMSLPPMILLIFWAVTIDWQGIYKKIITRNAQTSPKLDKLRARMQKNRAGERLIGNWFYDKIYKFLLILEHDMIDHVKACCREDRSLLFSRNKQHPKLKCGRKIFLRKLRQLHREESTKIIVKDSDIISLHNVQDPDKDFLKFYRLLTHLGRRKFFKRLNKIKFEPTD